MPAVIRLKRTGAKSKEAHRIVVMDKRSPRDGKTLEILGSYDPKTEPATIKVNVERAGYWLGVGAVPSAAVKTLLKKQGMKL